MNTVKSISIFALLAATTFSSAQSILFHTPETVASGAVDYQLALNPAGAAAFDGDNRLHLVYWSASGVTTPASPSFIYYRNWTEADGWSAEEVIDDSTIDLGDGPQHFGGRHPQLAVEASGRVTAVWHDHRHTNPDPPGNSIDNIEIYLDRRPAGGDFSASDLRVTQTGSGNGGDNGYLPAIVNTGSGLAIAWHDFNAAPDESDLYAVISDNSGEFALPVSLGSARLTDGAARNDVPYSAVVLAGEPEGSLHAVWATGFGGVTPMFYAEISTPPSFVSEQEIAAQTDGYDRPPAMKVSPSGDLWIVYTTRDGAERDLMLLRKRDGAENFEAPAALRTQTGVSETAGSLAFTADGTAHLVWVQEDDERHVCHGIIAPGADAISRIQQLTTTDGDWARPVISLDSFGNPLVIFEDDPPLVNGSVFAVRGVSPTNAGNWSLYR